MNAVALVLAGHLIGDWIVQTDAQAANKTRSWAAMGRHMVGYHAALLGLAGLALDWPAVVALGFVSLTTHGFIDRRWPVIWLMAHTGSRPFSATPWGVLVVDQAIHLSVVLLVVAIAPAVL